VDVVVNVVLDVVVNRDADVVAVVFVNAHEGCGDTFAI
jgi:hypothetical protein